MLINGYFSQTLLSPVVCCGLGTGGSLLKPAVLSFEHCASLQHATWQLHIFSTPATNTHTASSTSSGSSSSKASGNNDDTWTRLITMGEERIDTPVFTQLDGAQVRGEKVRHFCRTLRNFKLYMYIRDYPIISTGLADYTLYDPVTNKSSWYVYEISVCCLCYSF